MYSVVWEFEVQPGLEADFEQIYDNSGPWVLLFQRSPQYLGTDLLRSPDQKGRYLTVDRWSTREGFDEFVQDHQGAYQSLDRRCRKLTARETCIGWFVAAIGKSDTYRF